MICKKCKKQIDDDSKFCEFCGMSLLEIRKNKYSNSSKNRNFSKNFLQLDFLLVIFGMVFLFYGSFLLNAETVLPVNRQEMLDIARGVKDPEMNDGYKTFYSFLRIYIFFTISYLFFANHKKINSIVLFILFIAAIIYNPIRILSFEPEEMQLIDFFVGLFFVYYAYMIINKKV